MSKPIDTRDVERRGQEVSGWLECRGYPQAGEVVEGLVNAIRQERERAERSEAALHELLWALNEIAQWDQGDLGPGLSEPSSAEIARGTLDRLRNTPEGAALIRQAEERSGST